MHFYADKKLAELACLFVKKGHSGMGYGRILVEAAKARARELEAECLFALTTQAAVYLEKEGFEKQEDLSLLPENRLEKWRANNRNAVLMIHSK